MFRLGVLTMAVDTRRKMVDRGRMFSHVKKAKKDQRPAEWMLTIRSVLFTPEGRESLEVLDHANIEHPWIIVQGLGRPPRRCHLAEIRPGSYFAL